VGEEAAIAALVAPYPEPQEDLAVGGQWAFADTFREDQGRLVYGIERLVEYVARHYPVDRARVVVAGHGRGALPVLWAAMYAEWLDARCVAIEPRDLRPFRREGLPDRPSSVRGLDVVSAEPMSDLAADFADVGVEVVETRVRTGAEPAGWQVENAVRKALGLAPRSYAAAAAAGPRTLLVLEHNGPRARAWAEIEAASVQREGGVCSVVTADQVDPALQGDVVRVRSLQSQDLARRDLPLAPGPFGGTTVVVVPAGAAPAERDAWRKLESSGAIRERSPFASLRIAFADAEPTLPAVLAELRAAHRSNVLITPAVFCATPEQMQALRRSATAELAGLDVTWHPGLGAN
jgi:hypothetical protein